MSSEPIEYIPKDLWTAANKQQVLELLISLDLPGYVKRDLMLRWALTVRSRWTEYEVVSVVGSGNEPEYRR